MDASSRVEHFGLMACLGLFILAGCGGPALQPIAARDVGAIRTAWMASDAKAHNLLYVADTMYGIGHVNVYSYPEGKLKGQISGVPSGEGLCSDHQGNVFIPVGSSILEYAHGGSEPINVLNDQYGGALFCSVDPKTGNLAVSPTVAVYSHAQGDPTAYPGGLAEGNFSCTYDDKGNLFVNGYLEPNVEKMGLVELRRGDTSFTNILFPFVVQFGAIQWDGKYLTLGIISPTYFGRFHITANSAQRVGSWIAFDDAPFIGQFWITRKKLIVPVIQSQSGGPNSVNVYDYPAGGAPTKIIGGDDNLHTPSGVTLSVARR